MAELIYTFGLKTYWLLINVAALFNPKAKAFITGRKKVWGSLEEQLAQNSAPVLWAHCASVGEYEQGLPVLTAFKQACPHYKILVTFYSPSGYEAIHRNAIIDFKAYLPFDSRKNARRLLAVVKPKLVLFIKYEFWHFYLHELHKQNIPVFSISSIFRPGQVFFKWYGRYYKEMLHYFTFFFVQDKISAQLLQQEGLPHRVTGDTRLDRVLAIRAQKKPVKDIEKITKGHKVMVIGSLRKEDIPLITNFIARQPEIKFIVAPHEITEAMIRPLERALPSIVRYSTMVNLQNEPQVIVIDNIGMLSQLYQYADYAYVGGGFSDGLHNILEPAVFQIPVFFGNKAYQKFKEAVDLAALGAAFPVANLQELTRVFDKLQQDPARQTEISHKIAGYLAEHKGAAGKIINHLKGFLP